MEIKGKKVGILVEELYQELEVWYPLLRLKEAGGEVHVIGPEKKAYKSKLGYPAEADRKASEVKAADYDAIVIPGGYAPDIMRRHREMVDIVKEALDAKKVVASICHGGWMLCSSGGIEDRKVTGFFAIADDLKNAGAEYVDEEVVVDGGNLVTSRTPDDLPAFCRAIIECLQ